MAGKASGISLYRDDARIILGMVARGDREHDIAAWFGVNQGRIAEVKKGEYGTLEAAPADQLPPSGPPGVKGRRLYTAVRAALDLLEKGEVESVGSTLGKALGVYDTNEG